MTQILFCSGLAILALLRSVEASSGEEELIRGVVAAFPTAWNRHDVRALASLWTPTGDLVSLFGATARGRSEVERLLEQDHGTLMEGTRLSWTPRSLRMERPDVAVVDCDAVLTGMRRKPNPFRKSEHGPQGAGPVTHWVTAVLTKTDGKWWFAVVRFMKPMEVSWYVADHEDAPSRR